MIKDAAVQIHMGYTPEKREGFTTDEAHYTGATKIPRVEVSATLSPGELVTLVAALGETVDGIEAARAQRESDLRKAASAPAQG